MSTEQLRKEIFESCEALIKELVYLIRQNFAVKTLPVHNVPYILMEPSGPGSESGRECYFEEKDLSSVWDKIEPILTADLSWKRAYDAIKAFINAFSVKPEGLIQDIAHSYLWPLCISYLTLAPSVSFRSRLAFRVINAFLQRLSAQGSYYIGFAILNDFKADRPFRLAEGITVRPLNEKDIPTLVDRSPVTTHQDANNWIHAKWWVCEIIMMNQRGTYLAQNKISEMIHDELPVIFRAFKRGDIEIKLGVIKTLEPYGDVGVINRGSLYDRIGIGSSPYNLSNAEINRFVRFYSDIQPLLKNKDHYLQIPLRRMRYAGNRREKSDALIDYVIGLEALLSAKSERQTEIGYRFRIRGSVILAPKKNQRPGYIKRLERIYELRSRIVHGDHVSEKDLSESVDFAEDALRNVWQWYFINFRTETNNTSAIDRIDAELAVK